jgi:hypothetical protein
VRLGTVAGDDVLDRLRRVDFVGGVEQIDEQRLD